MSGIAQIARFVVKPERDSAFGVRLEEIVAQTRTEPGCDGYALFRDASERWTVVELWRDDAAVEAHLAQPYIVALLAELEEFIAEAPIVEVMRR